jgi:elongation factor 1-gamma
MTTVEVFCYPGGDRVAKAMIAGKYANVNVTAPAFNFGTDNETTQYLLNCHPLGRVPVAKTQEGYLFESNSIVRYLARLDASGALYGGSGAYQASQVDQWIDFTANEVEPAINVMVGPILGYLEKDAKQQECAAKTVLAVFDTLNTQFEVRTFLVGERVTAADIVLGTLLEKFFRLVTDKKFKEGRVNLMRYVDTCINQPHFAAVFAEMSKKAAPAAAKKEEPKKEAPKKKAKKDDDDDEEDDVAAALTMPGDNDPAKLAKNALDSLPPSTFNMDEFKRTYSNEDTLKVAVPYLLKNFDAEGFTAFWATYKYNEELQQQPFMTANLVSGWFQRMDHLHKYLFAAVCVCGDNKKQNISGLFIVRGKGMPQLMSMVDDIENYTWEHIPSLEAVKDKMADYLNCDGPTFASNPVVEYRIYK